MDNLNSFSWKIFYQLVGSATLFLIFGLAIIFAFIRGFENKINKKIDEHWRNLHKHGGLFK